MSSRKVRDSPNSKIGIGRTRDALKIGWGPGAQDLLHVNGRKAHVPLADSCT